MTPSDHNKLLGILHLIHGGLQLLSVMVVIIMMVVFGAIGFTSNDAAAPMAIMLFIMFFVLAISLILTIPPLAAGYGMLKGKRWARTAGIISGFIALIGIPLGTALGVYSLWFLLGEQGKRFHLGQGAYGELGGPPPPPASWNEDYLFNEGHRQPSQPQQQPPPHHQNWRG